MVRIIGRLTWALLLVAMSAVVWNGRAMAQCLTGFPTCCLGDCNGDGQAKSGELTKIVAIILNCDGAPATGCPAIPGTDKQCVNGDRNGNGILSAGEQTNVVSNILNFPSGCPPVATVTPGVPATNTPTNTVVPTVTPTPTQPVAAVCGNSVVEAGEDCDTGGTCIGGDNAGTACTSESDCIGHGVCTEGPHIGAACANDTACGGGGKCIHCKTFGGSGCAANCTFETDVVYNLVPGIVRVCNSGPKKDQSCTLTSDCPAGPAPTPAAACVNFTLCVGGSNNGAVCKSSADCPGAGVCLQGVKPGTSGAFVHDGIIQLALPLSGSQLLKVGKIRNNRLPYVVKAASVKLPKIPVSTLACACTRGVVGKTCGGTLFEEDGTTLSTNCSDDYTEGASLCAGQKPCALVSGAGNSAEGIVGCDSLEGVDLSFTQMSSFSQPPPTPPTPRPGSGPPIIALSGPGGAGSTVVLNTSAIGTTTAAHVPGNVCKGVAPCAPTSDFGADCDFCTDDDPQSVRGAANTLPQVTGMASAEIFMSADSPQIDQNIGPFTVEGSPLTCEELASGSISGLSTAGAFTALNQPSTHDIVVTNVFVGQ
jgi:hypothetical protein